MITERHNLACQMILKAISKTGSLGSCVVSIDIGSNKRMTMRHLQVPETAELLEKYSSSQMALPTLLLR